MCKETIEESGCIDEDNCEVCHWLVSEEGTSPRGEVVTVLCCISEVMTAGGCCRSMEKRKWV